MDLMHIVPSIVSLCNNIKDFILNLHVLHEDRKELQHKLSLMAEVLDTTFAGVDLSGADHLAEALLEMKKNVGLLQYAIRKAAATAKLALFFKAGVVRSKIRDLISRMQHSCELLASVLSHRNPGVPRQSMSRMTSLSNGLLTVQLSAMQKQELLVSQLKQRLFKVYTRKFMEGHRSHESMAPDLMYVIKKWVPADLQPALVCKEELVAAIQELRIQEQEHQYHKERQDQLFMGQLVASLTLQLETLTEGGSTSHRHSQPGYPNHSLNHQNQQNSDTVMAGVKAPAGFFCPLTKRIMRDPVITMEGSTYERSAIQQWLTSSNTDPLTNVPLTTKHLISNRALRAVINEWRNEARSFLDGASEARSLNTTGLAQPVMTQPSSRQSNHSLRLSQPQLRPIRTDDKPLDDLHSIRNIHRDDSLSRVSAAESIAYTHDRAESVVYRNNNTRVHEPMAGLPIPNPNANPTTNMLLAHAQQKQQSSKAAGLPTAADLANMRYNSPSSSTLGAAGTAAVVTADTLAAGAVATVAVMNGNGHVLPNEATAANPTAADEIHGMDEESTADTMMTSSTVVLPGNTHGTNLSTAPTQQPAEPTSDLSRVSKRPGLAANSHIISNGAATTSQNGRVPILKAVSLPAALAPVPYRSPGSRSFSTSSPGWQPDRNLLYPPPEGPNSGSSTVKLQHGEPISPPGSPRSLAARSMANPDVLRQSYDSQATSTGSAILPGPPTKVATTWASQAPLHPPPPPPPSTVSDTVMPSRAVSGASDRQTVAQAVAANRHVAATQLSRKEDEIQPFEDEDSVQASGPSQPRVVQRYASYSSSDSPPNSQRGSDRQHALANGLVQLSRSIESQSPAPTSGAETLSGASSGELYARVRPVKGGKDVTSHDIGSLQSRRSAQVSSAKDTQSLVARNASYHRRQDSCSTVALSACSSPTAAAAEDAQALKSGQGRDSTETSCESSQASQSDATQRASSSGTGDSNDMIVHIEAKQLIGLQAAALVASAEASKAKQVPSELDVYYPRTTPQQYGAVSPSNVCSLEPTQSADWQQQVTTGGVVMSNPPAVLSPSAMPGAARVWKARMEGLADSFKRHSNSGEHALPLQGADSETNNTTLNSLDLQYTSFEVDGCKALAAALATNTTLHAPDMDGNVSMKESSNAVQAALSTTSSMHMLGLGGNHIDDNGVKAIAAALPTNTTLHMLGLGGNHITDEGAKAIAAVLPNNTTLQMLGLGGNHLRDEGAIALADSLAQNTTLHTLGLGGNHIRDAGAQSLAVCLSVNTTIHTLGLQFNAIGDEGAISIAAVLARNNTLQWLDLNQNSIGPIGCQALADALASNSSLNMLGIGSDKVGDAGCNALASGLAENQTLHTMELKGSCIGSEGGMALATALAQNTAMRSLNLYRNAIGVDSAMALVSNVVLTTLNLGCNDLGDDGAKAVAKALTVNTSLRTLNLRSNNIGDEGGEAIAEALYSNNTLKTLSLYDNNIGDFGGKALAAALSKNTILRTLNLDNNRIGQEGLRAMADVLQATARSATWV